MVNDSQVIDIFEEEVAKYAGAKYGVAVSSATNAIFLCLQYLLNTGQLTLDNTITLPSRTYLSVPCQVKLCGLNVNFNDYEWSGAYRLVPTRIYDAAVRFTKGMFPKDVPNALYCVSFQYKKHLKIGRGGMVLTDNLDAAYWLKKARFNGRSLGVPQKDDMLEFCGWNMYMMPEQAARGLTLMTLIPDDNEDIAGSKDYPDISSQEVFK